MLRRPYSKDVVVRRCWRGSSQDEARQRLPSSTMRAMLNDFDSGPSQRPLPTSVPGGANDLNPVIRMLGRRSGSP